MPEPKLGKLIAVHSTSPSFLQRAAIVAALSFLFFLVALIFYLIWQSFLYFMLATGFLIVQLFTMIGWWMQKRNAVTVYSRGILFRRRSIAWSEIRSVEMKDSSLTIALSSDESIDLPSSIQGLDRLRAYVRERIE